MYQFVEEIKMDKKFLKENSNFTTSEWDDAVLFIANIDAMFDINLFDDVYANGEQNSAFCDMFDIEKKIDIEKGELVKEYNCKPKICLYKTVTEDTTVFTIDDDSDDDYHVIVFDKNVKCTA